MTKTTPGYVLIIFRGGGQMKLAYASEKLGLQEIATWVNHKNKNNDPCLPCWRGEDKDGVYHGFLKDEVIAMQWIEPQPVNDSYERLIQSQKELVQVLKKQADTGEDWRGDDDV